MKKVWRVIKWIVLNGAMCYAFYNAMVLGSEISANIIKFVIWVFFVLAMILQCSDAEAKAKIKKMGPYVPCGVNLTYGVAYACGLAAYGWFGYATLEIITTLLMVNLYSKDEED
jgi:hypothetical protein